MCMSSKGYGWIPDIFDTNKLFSGKMFYLALILKVDQDFHIKLQHTETFLGWNIDKSYSKDQET